MKHACLILVLLMSATLSFAQSAKEADVTMTEGYGSENQEINDILGFEGIDYLKLSFKAKDLADKHFRLTVKQIWDGEVKSDSTILDSKTLPFEQFQKIGEKQFDMRVIAKHTADNRLKMTFKFPHFSVERSFEATASDDYSLRNVAEANETKITYGETFYLLAYILPYKKDNAKYYCAVEVSGKDIEQWGAEFGIEHYLVFEMLFD